MNRLNNKLSTCNNAARHFYFTQINKEIQRNDSLYPVIESANNKGKNQ